MTSGPASEKMIFLAAIERESPEERAAYLDQACGSNPWLRKEVEGLLAAHERLPGIRPAGEALGEGPGTVLGPYTLREPLGEGGFGVVFRAEQQQPLRRTVALKLLKPGLDTRQVVARFQAERQALALMDHPNIARVLDAGATAAGRPYFVMELVPGLPLTAYCDQNRLTLPERLELFAAVCAAVQHAHQKGVIHRDLKPSNVLVTRQDGAAVVKVIDFGIAKALGRPLADERPDTGLTQLVGTPLYMSPEQLEGGGLDVDTRSDVYSLGVLLYELLTGTTPFDKERLRHAGYDEFRRILREEDPPRPSTRGQATTTVLARRGGDRRLRRRFRGELDWVVMKALEKDRERRYDSAGALGADVRRYLADEPVQACPPSAGYRLRKWARRHRPAVGAVAAVLLVAVAAWAVSTVLILWQRDEAWAQRQAAQEQRELARRAVDEMYTEVAEQWLPHQPHLHEVRRRFLLKALGYYEAFAREPGTDPGQRHLAGVACRRVGDIQAKLGQTGDAEAAYGQAVGIQAELAAAFPEAPPYRQELATSQNNLGVLLMSVGRLDEAEQAHRRALAVRERLAADFPTERSHRGELADSQNNLGLLLRRAGRPREAERAFREAGALLEQLTAEDPAPQYRHGLARAQNNLASLLLFHGRPKEAEQALGRALAGQKKLAAEFPAVPRYRHELALTHANLAHFLRGSRRPGEAERELRAAVAVQQGLAAEFPGVAGYRLDLANSHRSLADVLYHAGRYAEAEESLRRAMALQEKLAAESPRVTDYRLLLAQGHHNLANVLRDTERYPEAERALGRALALYERLTAELPGMPQCLEGLAKSHRNLGYLLWETDRPKEAAAPFRRARALYDKLVAEDPGAAGIARDFAWFLADCPDPHAADVRRAARTAERAVRRPPVGPGWWNVLGVARYRAGKWRGAVEALQESRRVDPDDASWDGFYLAMAHWRLGEKGRARECYERACAALAENKVGRRKLLRLREEAASLLGLPAR
jgi:serine/threonine protein kinase/Tfp pilus assembly protein PilF